MSLSTKGRYFWARVVIWLGVAIHTTVLLALGISIIGALYLLSVVSWWALYHDRFVVRLYTVISMTGYALYYMHHGSMASADFWLLRITTGPAGASSCSNRPHIDIPYNPTGYLDYSNAAIVDHPHVQCPYPEMRWADDTDRPFGGVDADQVLDTQPVPCTDCQWASMIGSKYAMNKGRGLSHGWYAAAPIVDTVACPGVDRELNDAGRIGRGRAVCTTCTQWMVQAGKMEPQPHCSDMVSSAFCFVCPDPRMDVTSDVRSVAVSIIIFEALIVVHIAMHQWTKSVQPRIRYIRSYSKSQHAKADASSVP